MIMYKVHTYIRKSHFASNTPCYPPEQDLISNDGSIFVVLHATECDINYPTDGQKCDKNN